MANNSSNYGIVYVLTNQAMPGLVKIGMTNRDEVDTRMKELFNTGVPLPFKCEYACRVPADSCRKVEKALHKAFVKDKIHPDREFFTISADQAIAILELLDRSNEITDEIQSGIDNDLSATDKEASERFRKVRRPSLNFKEMNIPVGSKIRFIPDDGGMEVDVEVCSEKKVRYNGEERSLSSIEKELRGLGYSVRAGRHWTYNGRLINDIYNETYPFLEE